MESILELYLSVNRSSEGVQPLINLLLDSQSSDFQLALLVCREMKAKDEKYRPIQKSSKKKKELVSQGEKKGFGR